MSNINDIINDIDNFIIDKFNGSSDCWIFSVHKLLCSRYKMEPFHIEEGDYGYESYKCVILSILLSINTEDINLYLCGKLDLSKYVGVAHTAWSDNYIQWKYLNNYLIGDDPTTTLNTYDRNDRATTALSYINEDDMIQYHNIIDAIFTILSDKILEAGMEHLFLN